MQFENSKVVETLIFGEILITVRGGLSLTGLIKPFMFSDIFYHKDCAKTICGGPLKFSKLFKTFRLLKSQWSPGRPVNKFTKQHKKRVQLRAFSGTKIPRLGFTPPKIKTTKTVPNNRLPPSGSENIGREKYQQKKKLSRKQHEKIMFYTNHFVRRDRAMLAALSVMCSITNFLLLPFHVLVLVVVVFDAATGPDSIFQKMGPGTWTERR